MLRSAFYTGRKLPRSPRLGGLQAPQLVVSRAPRNEQVPKSNWAPTWVPSANAEFVTQRFFADAPKPSSNTKASILSSDPAFLPGSGSSEAPVKTPVPLGPISPAPGPASSSTPI